MRTSTATNKSMFAALFVSPFSVIPAMLVMAIASTIYSMLTGEFNFKSIHITSILQIVLSGIIGLVISVPATFIYGLPMYYFLKRIKTLNIYNATVVALIPAVIYGIYMQSIYVFIVVAYFSLWVAYTFWWMVPRDN